MLINMFAIRARDFMGRASAPSVEGRWFEPRSGQVKDWKIGTWYFPGYRSFKS